MEIAELMIRVRASFGLLDSAFEERYYDREIWKSRRHADPVGGFSLRLVRTRRGISDNRVKMIRTLAGADSRLIAVKAGGGYREAAVKSEAEQAFPGSAAASARGKTSELRSSPV